MLSRGDRIGVAVSGGPDSVALLHILYRLSSEYDLSLVMIHLNHGLRGEESERDEEFVSTLSDSMGLIVRLKKVSIPDLKKGRKGSLEDIARIERYRFFAEVSRDMGLRKIALGHNLDDQAETVIMKFLRGSGSDGLKGMVPVRSGKYIRPIIEITRDEVVQFLHCEGIGYITDSSNMDNSFLRNRIRNVLMPNLKTYYNPRLTENICHTAELMRLENDFIGLTAGTIIMKWGIALGTETVAVSIARLRECHPAVQLRIIKMLLEGAAIHQRGIGFAHVRTVFDILGEGRPNRRVDLPHGISVMREYDTLTVGRGGDKKGKSTRPKDDKWKMNDYIYHVDLPGHVRVEEAGLDVRFTVEDNHDCDYVSEDVAYMDYAMIDFPLIIRNMHPGDTIQPLGMGGTKKIKSYFIDEKVPRSLRGKIPLLVDQKSVVWVIGMKLSGKAAISDTTVKVVRAEII